jgi:ankyrin repeat protein
MCSDVTTASIKNGINTNVEDVFDKLPTECVERVIAFCDDAETVRNLSLTKRELRSLLCDVGVVTRWLGQACGDVELDAVVRICLERIDENKGTQGRENDVYQYYVRLLDSLVTSLKGYDVHHENEYVFRRECMHGNVFRAKFLIDNYCADPHVANGLAVLNAAKCGQTQFVEMMVTEYNVLHPHLLAAASRFNRVDILDMLLSSDRLHFFTDDQLNDAAEEALTTFGRRDSLKMLLDRAPNMLNVHTVNICSDDSDDADAEERHDVSTLSLAVQSGDMRTIEFLLAEGTDPYVNDGSFMFIAASEGRTELVLTLISRFWSDDLTMQQDLTHCAGRRGQAHLLDAMVERFGRAVLIDNFSQHDIKCVVDRRYVEVSDALIRHKIDTQGYSLRCAATNGDVELIVHFLDNTDVKKKDAAINNCLALITEDDDLSDVLDEFLIHVDEVSISVKSLFWSARNGRIDCLKTSLNRIIQSEKKSELYEVQNAALDLATENGHEFVIDFLKQRGAFDGTRKSTIAILFFICVLVPLKHGLLALVSLKVLHGLRDVELSRLLKKHRYISAVFIAGFSLLFFFYALCISLCVSIFLSSMLLRVGVYLYSFYDIFPLSSA